MNYKWEKKNKTKQKGIGNYIRVDLIKLFLKIIR